MTDMIKIAELVRAACLEAALEAYEDAGISGLCAEGRWEYAMQDISTGGGGYQAYYSGWPSNRGQSLAGANVADEATWLALFSRENYYSFQDNVFGISQFEMP